jgi:hypothetical protein
MSEGNHSAALLRARDDLDLTLARIRALLETLAAVHGPHGELPSPETLATMIRLALDHLKVIESLWHHCEELYRSEHSARSRDRTVN